jgi:flavodoxin
MNNETDGAKVIDLSRRNLLKAGVAWLFAGIASPLLPNPFTGHAAETGIAGRKTLITYFSRTGNTREIANQIHQRIGGEIIELQTVNPYPEDYDEMKNQARQELNSGFKPALKTRVNEIGSYDVIFVGTPIWWGTISAPVKSFLSQYNLSGKTVVPFVTHAGSGLGQSVSDISALCSHSTILDGLAVWGKNAKTAQNDVSTWIRGLRVKS